MNKKINFISGADVAADVTQTKKRITTWQHMDMTHGDVDVFARVYSCVCVRVIREIKFPFQDNDISLYRLYLIYALNPINFRHVGLILCFYVRR